MRTRRRVSEEGGSEAEEGGTGMRVAEGVCAGGKVGGWRLWLWLWYGWWDDGMVVSLESSSEGSMSRIEGRGGEGSVLWEMVDRWLRRGRRYVGGRWTALRE